MRLSFIILLCALGIAACNSGEKGSTIISGDTVSTTIPGDNPPSDKPDTGSNNPPVSPTDTVPKEEPPLSMADKALLGRHNLTLQWIGWNVPGLAVIEKGKDDWYTIKGRQENNKGYLLIDGKLRPVFENTEDAVLELEFDGLVEYKEESINAGKPCAKRGKQMFLSTQGRKYWRLQNMTNCDGVTTDYVDIYF